LRCKRIIKRRVLGNKGGFAKTFNILFILPTYKKDEDRDSVKAFFSKIKQGTSDQAHSL
jgi:hypothetical protein